MTAYAIRREGHPVLDQKAAEVVEFGGGLRSLARHMRDTMREFKGVGLAAPQIGKSVRVVVVAGGGFTATLVNPAIIARDSTQVFAQEGCLSVDRSRWRNVRRAEWVHVCWQTVHGDAREQVLDGYAARIVQHEMDHLDGVLITHK